MLPLVDPGIVLLPVWSCRDQYNRIDYIDHTRTIDWLNCVDSIDRLNDRSVQSIRLCIDCYKRRWLVYWCVGCIVEKNPGFGVEDSNPCFHCWWNRTVQHNRHTVLCNFQFFRIYSFRLWFCKIGLWRDSSHQICYEKSMEWFYSMKYKKFPRKIWFHKIVSCSVSEVHGKPPIPQNGFHGMESFCYIP